MVNFKEIYLFQGYRGGSNIFQGGGGSIETHITCDILGGGPPVPPLDPHLSGISSRQLTLKKGAPGDQVRDLLCMQLASYLEGGSLMWMMPLNLNQKSDYDIQ